MGEVLLRTAEDALRPLSPETVLRRNTIGDNAGNLVFRHAAQRILATAGTRVVPDRGIPPPAKAEEINERYDVYVLPLANAFRPSYEATLTRLTALIRRLRIPVVVLGVGHQATTANDWSRLDPMSASVKAFVSAVLDHGPTLGVRGELTADYLQALGFRDLDVIGCPSMFLHGADLTIRPQLPELGPEAKLTVTVSPYRPRMIRIVNRHAEAYPTMIYVPQDIATLEVLLHGHAAGLAEADDPRPLHHGHRLFREDRVRFFVATTPWFDFLAERDFTFGSRIHGAIASLVSGTPAFVLTHDSRTLELARYFDIPHRHLAKVDPDTVDASDLYRDVDLTQLVAGHPVRFARFVDYLDRHGLDHAFRSPAPDPDYATATAAAAWPPAVTAAASDSLGAGAKLTVRLRRRLKRLARVPWVRRLRVRLARRG